MNDKETQICSSDEDSNTLREQDLQQFYGTEHYYRHPIFRDYLCTDGAQYLAEKGKAFWLIDKILACQSCVKNLEGEDFCVWELTKREDRASLICTDGNGQKLYSETVLYTDFPLTSVQLYFVSNVLMLPSEY